MVFQATYFPPSCTTYPSGNGTQTSSNVYCTLSQVNNDTYPNTPNCTGLTYSLSFANKCQFFPNFNSTNQPFCNYSIPQTGIVGYIQTFTDYTCQTLTGQFTTFYAVCIPSVNGSKMYDCNGTDITITSYTDNNCSVGGVTMSYRKNGVCQNFKMSSCGTGVPPSVSGPASTASSTSSSSTNATSTSASSTNTSSTSSSSTSTSASSTNASSTSASSTNTSSTNTGSSSASSSSGSNSTASSSGSGSGTNSTASSSGSASSSSSSSGSSSSSNGVLITFSMLLVSFALIIV